MPLEWLTHRAYLEHEEEYDWVSVVLPRAIVTAYILTAGYGEPEGFTPKLTVEPRGEGSEQTIYYGERLLEFDAAKADLEERLGWLLKAVGPRETSE